MELLKKKLKTFVEERNWDQYHNPKNLLLSLVSEVGELAELFRWLTEKECEKVMQAPDLAPRIEDEMADVFNNLLLLAMKLNIDLIEVAKRKLDINATKYPKEIWRDKAHLKGKSLEK